MTPLKASWNCGKFAVTLETKINDEGLKILASAGILQFAQRAKIDEVLGAFVKEGDKNVRRPGWKRGDVEFSSELADKLSKLFSELEIADGVKIQLLPTVTEYVPTKAEPKFALARAAFIRHRDAGDLEVWLRGKIGHSGDVFDGDEPSESALRAIDAFVKAL